MKPKVAIIMGSDSDYPVMSAAREILRDLDIEVDAAIVSAHRMPERMFEFAKEAESNGYHVIIAGAGGAAHLPGMCAAFTPLPVLGVPVKSRALNGVDSLLSIAQMPKGVAVGTLAIGDAGAANAGLLAAQIIGSHNPDVMAKIEQFRANQTNAVLSQPDPSEDA